MARLHDDLLSAKDPVLTLRLAGAFCILAVLSNIFRCPLNALYVMIFWPCHLCLRHWKCSLCSVAWHKMNAWQGASFQSLSLTYPRQRELILVLLSPGLIPAELADFCQCICTRECARGCAACGGSYAWLSLELLAGE